MKIPGQPFAAEWPGKGKQSVSDRTCTPETQALFSKFLLSALRTAVLRCKLDCNEPTTIGTALANGWITPEGAVEWLADCGLVDQVIADEVKA